MKTGHFGYLLLAPAAVLLGVCLAFPIVQTVATSFYNDDQVLRTHDFVGLENYRRLLRDETAVASIEFTAIFAGVSVALETLAGLAIALVLSRPYRGIGLLRAAALLPWAFPTVVAAVLWKYLLNDQYGAVNFLLYGGDLGAYRAWLSEPATARFWIIAADVWKSSSFSALILLAGLQAIPGELYEAAKVDGAGTLRQFWRITLPSLKSFILLAVLFRLIDALRVFDLVFVMTEGGPYNSTQVLQLYGYRQMFAEGQFGYGSALSVVTFLAAGFLCLALTKVIRPAREA